MRDDGQSIERGADALDRLIASARAPDMQSAQPAPANATEADWSDDQAAFARLAALTPMQYDRCRKAEADALGIRVETLDKEVRRARGEPEVDLAGTAVMFPELEPWPDPVDGAELLDNIEGVIAKYVIIDAAARVAVVLWIVFTYLIDVVDTAPILGVTSPDKRCGKTTLLELLLLLVRRVLSSSNISAAALFRSIELWAPTFLIDEGDSFFGQSDELRGLLNSGHKRATAYVIRTVGDNHEPRRFCTWGAKAIAMIGRLSDTLEDRSIGVRMRRKLPSEKVAKLGRAEKASFETFRRRCQRWAEDVGVAIKQSQPKIPDELHDRAADNWEPLLAIADVAGGKWPAAARKAALGLSDVVDQSLGVNIELLADVAAAFGAAKTDRMSSEDLVNALCADPTKRWATLNKGKPLSQRQLASRLGKFDVVPIGIRIGDKTPRGYLLDKLKDPLCRYVPGFQAQQRNKPRPEPISDDSSSATESECCRSTIGQEAAPDAGCGVVADRNRVTGAGEVTEVL